MHIPDKSKVVPECARVVKSGGLIAFAGITLHKPLTTQEELCVSAEIKASGISPAEHCPGQLRAWQLPSFVQSPSGG